MCVCSCMICSDVTEVLLKPLTCLCTPCMCALSVFCLGTAFSPDLDISLMKAVEGQSDCLHRGTLQRAESCRCWAGEPAPVPAGNDSSVAAQLLSP